MITELRNKVYQQSRAWELFSDKVEEYIDHETGEITDETMYANYRKALDDLQPDNKLLALDIAKEIKNLEASIDVISNRQKELSERKKRFENQAESLKRLIISLGIEEKISDPFITVSPRIVKSYEYDEAAIPDEYFRNVKKLQKLDVKAAWKSGKLDKGVTEITKKSITIRTV